MRITKKLAAAAALALIAGSANALTCTGPSGTRTVTVNPIASCLTTGLGNLGDPAITALVAGSTMIDRDTANTNGGVLNITGVSAGSGTWTLASSIWSSYSSLYLYFHFGNGNPTDPTFNPDYFVIQLGSPVTAGTWSVNPTQLTLSNIALFGVPGTTTSVPEPASLALFGLGLGLLGLGLKRRGKAR